MEAKLKNGADALAREVGKRVRRKRLEHGWSQQKLGLGMGVSFQQVQKYEKGINALPLHKLLILASIWDIPPETLWRDDGDSRWTESDATEDEKGLCEVVRAYRGITDSEVRVQLLNLMRDLAQNHGIKAE